MANTGFKGIDVRQAGSQLVFRALLQSGNAIVSSGTTSLYLYELQSDGTLLSYDFSSNTFKSTALTTETLAMTHRTGNNSTTNTGFWSAALSTLTGFTIGAIYLARVVNSGATPTDQVREFQYASAEGDLLLTASGTTGQSFLRVDVRDWNGVAALPDGTALNSHDVLTAIGGPATLKPSDGLKFTVLTQDPTTGSLAAPGSTPTLSIRRDGVLDATPTFTISNNATGDYKATLAAGSLSGYAAGNLVEVMGTASVTPSGGGSAVAQTKVLLRFVLDSLRAGDLPAALLVQPTHPINNDTSGNITATTVVDKAGYGLSGAERTALAGVIMNDTTDTLGADELSLVAALAAVKVVTDKLGVTVQSNGTGGFQLTANALALAPTGGGSTVAVDGGTVSAVTSATVFSATGNLNAPSGGYAVIPQQILWITGANKGQRFAIASHGVSGSTHTFTVTGQTVAATPTTDTFFVI